MRPSALHRPVLLASTLALATSLLAGLPAATREAAEANPARQIHHRAWQGPAALAAGNHGGTRVVKNRLTTGTPATQKRVGGVAFGIHRWVSPWVEPGFALTELIPSWTGRTPGRSRIRIDVRPRSGGTVGSWDTVAVWAHHDQQFKRRTRSGQPDDLGRVDVDVWKAHAGAGVTGWQVRAVLMKPVSAKKAPSLTRIGAVASALPATAVATSAPGPGRGVVLDVPQYSQMIHRGHYPQWGGGGQAWCSPTATSMVLGYYGRLPKPKAYAWVGSGHSDPWVDHAARSTYDYAYRGTGNWAFNTAYAGTLLGPQAGSFVTRLRSLREAEDFIVAGIPLVASISFGSGQLSGAPISATAGHLVVIVGFAANGNVIVNDPAAPSNATVRRTYNRAQFENAWLPRSGGLTYVIHTPARPLPARAGRANW